MRKRKPSSGDSGNSRPSGLPTGPTGRRIIVLRPDSVQVGINAVEQIAGIRATVSSELTPATADPGRGSILFEELDIMVVDGDADQFGALEASVSDNASPVLSIEPEMYVAPMNDPDADGHPSAPGRDYIQGYADAIRALAAHLLATGDGFPVEADAMEIATAYLGDTASTWGLRATRVASSNWSGAGMRVAVLDTGMDLDHPDFAGRSIVQRSFVPGQSVQDGHGHGTHCVGISCGPKQPRDGGQRYGIAHDATILAGKVLANDGSGTSGQVLAGIDWALANRATVISLSLGGKKVPGHAHSPAFEQAALAALNAGSLIVAAAGDGSSIPASCPSVMAVGAIDDHLRRIDRYCLANHGNAVAFDIAAPGAGIHSAAPMPRRYATMSGASVAAPHVAGIAALWAERTGLRGRALWRKLTGNAHLVAQATPAACDRLAQAPVRRVVPPIHRVPAPVRHPPS